MNLITAQRLALDLMSEHGLIGIGWSFRFDNAKRSLGQTNYAKKTISLSRHVTPLIDEEKVRLTILHEIAHAHTPGHGHGPVWRRMCIAIGGDGKRCTELSFEETPKGKYIATCPQGHQHYCDRLPKRAMRCVKCARAGLPASIEYATVS